MPNGDPRDGFFYPTLTLMIDSYILEHYGVLCPVLLCFFIANQLANLLLIQVDVARNFQKKDQIKKTIKAMATYKMNKLHLHLSDDEGWRLEMPGIPELTNVSNNS